MKNNSSTNNILNQIFISTTNGFNDVSQKQSFWNEFAKKTNGIFKIQRTRTKDITIYNLTITLEYGQICFKESDIHPLKVICTIFSDTIINFTISKEDAVDRLLKIFGNREIEIGHSDFDKKYLVKASEVNTIKKILNDISIINLILKVDIYSISCMKNHKQIEITGVINSKVKSMTDMEDVFCLFKTIINQIKKL